MLERVKAYIKESYQELKKVVWPTRRQTISHTTAVIFISLTVAAFLGFIDYALQLGLEQLFQR